MLFLIGEDNKKSRSKNIDLGKSCWMSIGAPVVTSLADLEIFGVDLHNIEERSVGNIVSTNDPQI